jgi:hypothetical protein
MPRLDSGTEPFARLLGEEGAEIADGTEKRGPVPNSLLSVLSFII